MKKLKCIGYKCTRPVEVTCTVSHQQKELGGVASMCLLCYNIYFGKDWMVTVLNGLKRWVPPLTKKKRVVKSNLTL